MFAVVNVNVPKVVVFVPSVILGEMLIVGDDPVVMLPAQNISIVFPAAKKFVAKVALPVSVPSKVTAVPLVTAVIVFV
jgi:hypothetical protein